MKLNKGLPGETPLDDYSGLKQKWIKNISDRARAELENNLKAFRKYLLRTPTKRMAPFSAEWMIRVHFQMFADVWTWAGEIRRTVKNIGVKPVLIRLDLEELARDIEYWRSGQWADGFEQGVHIHHRAVKIHPFEDGNGRWARLLANIWLKQNGLPIISWPDIGPLASKSQTRRQYIQAIKIADKGNLVPLIKLHEKYSLTDAI